MCECDYQGEVEVEAHIHLLDFSHEDAEKATFFSLIHGYESADSGNFANGEHHLPPGPKS